MLMLHLQACSQPHWITLYWGYAFYRKPLSILSCPQTTNLLTALRTQPKLRVDELGLTGVEDTILAFLAGSQVQNNSQLKPLTQLAAQQPRVLSDIVSQPAVWIAYTPLTFILLLLLCLLGTPVWSSLLASAVCTSICVLYAAQQRLLLGRQEQIAVLRARKAVAGGLADQQEALALQADKTADKPLPPTQILLTLLGAEVTDSVSAEGGRGSFCVQKLACTSKLSLDRAALL